MKKQEKIFTSEIGVIWRRFFQCTIQPHIIWAITKWHSEKHHNDAAQSLMHTRRDDRTAAIVFGPEPYFEIFCRENDDLSTGKFSPGLNFFIVGHGLVNPKFWGQLHDLRKKRVAEYADRLPWHRLYHNSHNKDEFIAVLGFTSKAEFEKISEVGDFRLEEYLYTGLAKPLAMTYLAGYNQFICHPLNLAPAHD